MSKPEPVEPLCEFLPMTDIPFCPHAQVLFRSNAIALCHVALGMRENKVMGKVDWVKRPWDEMIHRGLCRNGLRAVQASPVLRI